MVVFLVTEAGKQYHCNEWFAATLDKVISTWFSWQVEAWAWNIIINRKIGDYSSLFIDRDATLSTWLPTVTQYDMELIHLLHVDITVACKVCEAY